MTTNKLFSLISVIFYLLCFLFVFAMILCLLLAGGESTEHLSFFKGLAQGFMFLGLSVLSGLLALLSYKLARFYDKKAVAAAKRRK